MKNLKTVTKNLEELQNDGLTIPDNSEIMQCTPIREPQKRGCDDKNVVAACNAIKKWLSSPRIAERKKSATQSPERRFRSSPLKTEDASDPVVEDLASSSGPSESVPGLHDDRLVMSLSPKEVDDPASSIGNDVDVFRGNMDDGTPPASTPLLQRFKAKRSIDTWSVSAKSTLMDEEVNQGKHANTNLQACPVGRWLIQVNEPCTTSVTDDIVHVYTQDIDTCTGDLLPEVEYPETLQERLTGPCRDYKDMAWRQSNMTSELQIRREILSRERMAAAVRSQLETGNETQNNLATGEEEKKEEEVAWPKADCVVRPVEVGDFQDIADIMNLEISAAGCPQFVESQEIKASDIKAIYGLCRRTMRPFIVATSPDNELLDRSKWPKGSDKAYAEYIRYQKTQSAHKETIFGFAFIKDARQGVLEAPDSSSGYSFSCQIKMAVHPDHRRERYGSALVDRILLSTAPYHKSLLDYTWRCRDTTLVYEEFAGHNHRQYNWIYVEALCIAKEHPDHQWRSAFLELFGFKEAAFFPDAAKTDRGYESEWLSLSLWALEAQPAFKIVDRNPEGAKRHHRGK